MIRHDLDAGVVAPARLVTRKWPFFQSDRVDDQRVCFPLADGISHPGQLQIAGMRTPIRGNHTKEMHVLIKDHNIAGGLNPLLRIGRQYYPWKPNGQTKRLWIIVTQVPGPFVIEEILSTGPEQIGVDLWIEPRR